MSYLVLARKWRPRTFAEVVGQGTVTRTLQNALGSGRIGHAFLLSGARGVGKTTTARILARALNCSAAEGPTAEPCGECSSCVEIAAGSSLDVQEIDGATHNGVEQVRELRESARYNPARDRFKVWIIDEVHMLSTGAFNALLKTLEEPPPRVKFIFATTEYHKLPDTILSRCQQYDFRMISAREIQAHLRTVAGGEAIQVSDDALARIARAAEGSARDALSLFDQVLSFSGSQVRDEDISVLLGLIDRELLLAASRAAAAGDSLALLELVERLSEYGADYRNFNRELLLHFREILLLKLAPSESALLSQIVPEERERLRPLEAAFSEEDLLRIFDVLIKVEQDLRWAQDPRVTLELALLKIVQMRRLVPWSDLVARVEALSGGAPAPVRNQPVPATNRATERTENTERTVARTPPAMPQRVPADAPPVDRQPEPSGPPAGAAGRDARAGPGAAVAGHAAAGRDPRRSGRHRGAAGRARLPGDGAHARGRVQGRGPQGQRPAALGPHRVGQGGGAGRRGGAGRGRERAPARGGRPPAGGQGDAGPVRWPHRGRARSQGGTPGNPFGNPQKLMKQFQQMQEKMQQEIAALEVEGTAGGGMVKVTMDGSKNVKSLVIDPEVVSKDEVEMLQDLVTAAFGDCARKVDEALQEKLGGMAGGMKIPGLF